MPPIVILGRATLLAAISLIATRSKKAVSTVDAFVGVVPKFQHRLSSYSHYERMSTISSSNEFDTITEDSLFQRTPLIQSPSLTSLVGSPVYLKLDCLQPSGSFKDRGMAHLCYTVKKAGMSKLISSSGGNAGLAVATVGKKLGMDVRVVVPQTTKAIVLDKLRRLGAEVTVHGENWNAADALARQWVSEDTDARYVSPYDDPLLWTGHSTAVDEIVEDLKDERIGALIASVGGGGLLCGIFEGLQRNAKNTVGIADTLVVGAETEGAASLAATLRNGPGTKIDAINSVATSLGALEVTPVLLDRATSHGMSKFKSSTCTDAEAVDACVQFASDHRMLVEPACGAALAVVYSERLRKEYLSGLSGPIVVEVCGGSGVNMDLLQGWKEQFGS